MGSQQCQFASLQTFSWNIFFLEPGSSNGPGNITKIQERSSRVWSSDASYEGKTSKFHRMVSGKYLNFQHTGIYLVKEALTDPKIKVHNTCTHPFLRINVLELSSRDSSIKQGKGSLISTNVRSLFWKNSFVYSPFRFWQLHLRIYTPGRGHDWSLRSFFSRTWMLHDGIALNVSPGLLGLSIFLFSFRELGFWTWTLFFIENVFLWFLHIGPYTSLQHTLSQC